MRDRLLTALRGVAALLTVGASLVVAPVPAAAAQADDQQAVQNYAGCLNGRRTGDLLLLIDESGSLGNPVRGRPPTDPDGQRVRAAKYLLTQLADRADRAGITIDVQIAGFATEFDRNPSAWTALTPTTLADLTKKVDDFATRDSGQDTDYWTALDGARASLADHRTVDAGEAGRCQAVAWFSDGGLDITAATAQQRRSDGSAAPTTNEDAQEALCAPSGTAEQLRRANVVMFGIGLAPPGTPENEFDLMRSITTGRTDDGGSCGTTTDPAPGTFTPAADIDELIPAFDQILGRPDIVGSPTDVCIQADATCRGQEFVLDGSIDSVNVLGQADIAAAGLTAELVGPDGERVELSVKDAGRTNELRLAAASGDYSWQSERTVVINLDYPKGPDASGNAPGWSGVWALRFVAPQAAGKSTTNIRVSGNIEPVWTDARPSLPTGQDQEIRLSLGKIDKTPVDPGSIKGTYRLSAAIVDPASGRPLEAPRALAEDTIGPVTLPLRAVPEGQFALRLTLDLTTAPATRRDTGERVPGTRLAPAIVDIPLLVEPPPGYPVLPPRLDFGAASDGATELTARMAVRGPGCVWVPAEPAPTVTTLPTGTGSVTVAADDFTSSQACLSLADGQTGDVVVHLRADHAGNGTATGTLPVSIAPPRPARPGPDGGHRVHRRPPEPAQSGQLLADAHRGAAARSGDSTGVALPRQVGHGPDPRTRPVRPDDPRDGRGRPDHARRSTVPVPR